MKTNAIHRAIGRKRKYKKINEKNCPILKEYRLVHGYETKKRKSKRK